jgi:hypothetical protein
MVQLNRSEVKVFHAYLHHLNVVFILNFIKMQPIRIRFTPGFLSGGGFSAEHLVFGGFFFILVNSTAVLLTSMTLFCQISQKQLFL